MSGDERSTNSIPGALSPTSGGLMSVAATVSARPTLNLRSHCDNCTVEPIPNKWRNECIRRLAPVRGDTTQKRSHAEAYDLARRIFAKRGTQRTLDEAKSKDKEDSSIPWETLRWYRQLSELQSTAQDSHSQSYGKGLLPLEAK
eukprot:gb/GECG01008727.1/.p1 GENE.gb/GECG01008727.1/~~gb/GECG01008727.1/.p1  ORF type:complete len:144 (+),score=13.14 gb/GECG01008727.1/:1-432(+)